MRKQLQTRKTIGDYFSSWPRGVLHWLRTLWRSIYLWFGVVPLALAALVIIALHRFMDMEKITEHLGSEAVGLLVGIPLVYLLVEAVLHRREAKEWAAGGV